MPAVMEPPTKTAPLEAEPPQTMTVEEFLELPDDDGVDRELIRGVLKERPMTMRARTHFFTESKIVSRLDQHIEEAEIDALVGSGEAGVVFDEQHSGVGIDVVVVAKSLVAEQDERTRMLFGVPLMTVEILSESDKVGEVYDKVQLYLEAGVQLAWVADPRQRTITAYRAGEPPKFFSGDDVVDAEPVLPGFGVEVGRLFA